MSLRGSETTEAISHCIDNSEIAALPSVARNDKKGIVTQSVCRYDGFAGTLVIATQSPSRTMTNYFRDSTLAAYDWILILR